MRLRWNLVGWCNPMTQTQMCKVNKSFFLNEAQFWGTNRKLKKKFCKPYCVILYQIKGLWGSKICFVIIVKKQFWFNSWKKTKIDHCPPFFFGWEIIKWLLPLWAEQEGVSDFYWLKPIHVPSSPFVFRGHGISFEQSRNPGWVTTLPYRVSSVPRKTR